MSADAKKHTNRLASETSPYLLQHAHNPVDWYPWGEAALARARTEDRPILLSVGYAACHWCHVMERESFEDERTAALMNEHFVCIKVDREERPDIDDIYMSATIAMSGSGGWPMTVFLTPEQKPFFAGTYFPPRETHGRPSFSALLQRIAHLWKTERPKVLSQAAELGEHLTEQAAPDRPTSVGEPAMRAAMTELARTFDPTYGGFGHAPKFPPTGALELCLRHHRRTGDDQALAMVTATLEGMQNGGMRDHLGGGFARYSTDERWLVPHFEKMLYDNALLPRVYAAAHQVTGRADFRRVAVEGLDYVLREMTSPEGGFYSATDADSEGEEGKFFVFSVEDVEAVLPPEQARAFAAYYDVTAHGNWEGKAILHTPRPLAEVARELGASAAGLEALLAAARDKMYRARLERVPPLLDDKVLVAWNALMIGTLAECGRIFGEPRYVAAAARAADFLFGALRRPDGGFFRTYRKGKAHLAAYLEDYAYLADALVDLYEASGEPVHLERARAVAARLRADFDDPDGGGFFTTAHDHEALLVRKRDGQDGAIPNANAVAARALLRLAWHAGPDKGAALRERAASAIRAHGRLIEKAPRAFVTSLAVLDMLLEGPTEIVIAGSLADARRAPLLAELGGHYLPNRVVVHHDPAAPAVSEFVGDKGLVGGAPAVYVCRDFACRAPAGDAAGIRAALGAMRSTLNDGRKESVRVTRRPHAATGAATAAYAARFRDAFAASAFRPFGRTGLVASAFGFGAYRVDDDEEDHVLALEHALEQGVNLIDTSTNYMDGGSERAVGAALARAAQKGILREEIIVVSKIGYVQGRNLDIVTAREAEGRPYPDMVRYAEGCFHCIHPEFLKDQLERSLERLGLERLDVLLLHNPEYFFSDAEKRGQKVDEALRAAFYERVERAFAHFEAEVRAGRIGCYGVSSNTVAKPASDAEATELERFVAAAERAGGADHHLRVLQLPLNLFEGEAALGEPSVLARAAARGLAVLANRPLNAMQGQGMLRLADPPAHACHGAEPFEDARRALAALEARFNRELAPLVKLAKESPPASSVFRWAEELDGVEPMIESSEHFEELAHGLIVPRTTQAFALFDRALPGSAKSAYVSWRGEYVRALEGVLEALRHTALERTGARLALVRQKLDPLLPPERRRAPLAQKALAALVSLPGLTTVLLGMRRIPYVEDALAVMREGPLAAPEAVLRALREG